MIELEHKGQKILLTNKDHEQLLKRFDIANFKPTREGHMCNDTPCPLCRKHLGPDRRCGKCPLAKFDNRASGIDGCRVVLRELLNSSYTYLDMLQSSVFFYPTVIYHEQGAPAQLRKIMGFLNTGRRTTRRKEKCNVFQSQKECRLNIGRTDTNCPNCGSSRLRRRMIDLPVLEDAISFKKAKIVYCPDCKISQISEESLKELVGRLERAGAKVDIHTFSASVREGLDRRKK